MDFAEFRFPALGQEPFLHLLRWEPGIPSHQPGRPVRVNKSGSLSMGGGGGGAGAPCSADIGCHHKRAFQNGVAVEFLSWLSGLPTQLVSMRMRVQSLATLSGLRLGMAMSSGVGHRHGSDPVLLCLWCRPHKWWLQIGAVALANVSSNWEFPSWLSG